MTREEFLAQLPDLVKNYQPAPDVLNQIKNVDLLLIIGPSGVGKTTLIQNSGLAYVVSDTTRPIRPEETEGDDYFFRSDYDQLLNEIKTGRFVQVAVGSGGDFYATKDTSYPTSGVAIMGVVTDAIPIFKGLGFKKTTSAYITPQSYDEWMKRITKHHLDEDQMNKRLAEGRRSLEYGLADPQMHFILNDQLNLAEEQLLDLLIGKVNESREVQTKLTAINLLNELRKAGV